MRHPFRIIAPHVVVAALVLCGTSSALAVAASHGARDASETTAS
jgi:hypothetical protein